MYKVNFDIESEVKDLLGYYSPKLIFVAIKDDYIKQIDILKDCGLNYNVENEVVKHLNRIISII